MADITVTKLSETLRISADRLITQLAEAGIADKKANSPIAAAEKNQLLSYLREKRLQGASANVESVSIAKQSVRGGVTVQVKTKKPTAAANQANVTVAEIDTSDATETTDKTTAKINEIPVPQTAEPETDQYRLQAQKRQEMMRLQRQQEEQLANQRKAAQEKQTTPPQTTTEKTTIVAKEATTPAANQRQKRQQYTVDKNTGLERTGAGKRTKKLKKKDKTRIAQELLKEQQQAHTFVKPVDPVIHEISISENISVTDLAQKMSTKTGEVLKVLMDMGVMVTLNDTIDQDTAVLVIEEMGHKALISGINTVEDTMLLQEAPTSTTKQLTRPPVVTIMGHVDHGKTSILDTIRKTKVSAGEAGGITQHIGAYQAEHDGKTITFIDTPGHAAFTKMRARGANTTDIVILVVAADDGVMPQTIESINHAKVAGVPIIVAVNKMDKEGADIEKVKQALSSHEVIAEDWGGDVMMVGVSAHSGEGIDTLLENILLQAEVLELKAPVEDKAKGVVLEARLDKGRGKVTSILVQEGTLKKGDIILAGLEYGRIKMLLNDSGAQIKQATPSMPVEVLGLSGIPESGDEVLALKNEKQAREVAEFRQQRNREKKLQKQQASKVSDFFAQMEDNNNKVLNLIIKADVRGSAQAIVDALEDLATDEVSVNIITSSIGGITESDVTLAQSSQAIILGFNVRTDAVAKKTAEKESVDVRYYSIIYQLIDEIKAIMGGLLSPTLSEKIIGMAQVREVFKSPKMGDIAGCMVTEGTIKRNSPIRVLRDNVVIYEGELESLKRFKDDVSEVRAGTECGIGVKNYNNVQIGDEIEIFERVETSRTL